MIRAGNRADRWVILLAVIALTVAACGGGSEAGDESTTTTDAAATTTAAPTTTVAEETTTTEAAAMGGTWDTGYGDPVTLDGIPGSAYAWGLQAMESLAVIGVAPTAYSSRFEGVPSWIGETWPEAVQLGQPPAVEDLVALQPDLIMADEGDDLTAITELAPVLTLRANDLTDTIDQLIIIGQIWDREAEAQAFIDEFMGRLDETKATIGDQGDAPRVMVVYPGVEPGVLGMWLDSSFIGSLLTELGADVALKLDGLSAADTEGDNADRATRFGLVQLGLEKIVELDPDALFVLGSPAQELIDELSAFGAWSTLTAVQNDRVYGFDRDLWSRSRGPIAMSEILDQARHSLYPDLFPAP